MQPCRPCPYSNASIGRAAFRSNYYSWVSNTGKWWCNKISCSKILFPIPLPIHRNFLFLRHQKFPFPRHWNYSVSAPLKTKFCFHSTWNETLFPLHLKQNSVSKLHYSIKTNSHCRCCCRPCHSRQHFSRRCHIAVAVIFVLAATIAVAATAAIVAAVVAALLLSLPPLPLLPSLSLSLLLLPPLPQSPVT